MKTLEIFLLSVRFVCASRGFLKAIKKRLAQALNTECGFITIRDGCFCLTYSKKDSIKLFHYMYSRREGELYLKRKYNKFQEAFKFAGAVA